MICYLSLGSNLRTPQRQIEIAVKHLRALPRTAMLKISTPFFNPAVGRRAQPPFCNIAVKLNTHLSPEQLLQHCLAIEKKQQRVRKVRWGARTIDIDILLYGQEQIQRPHLTIPHPRLHERAFVLTPLKNLGVDL